MVLNKPNLSGNLADVWLNESHGELLLSILDVAKKVLSVDNVGFNNMIVEINDSLPDIYFTSNQGSNKLFLNLGGFVFKDITDQAGIGGNMPWSTGVSLADVNADGLLDLYVCNSGDLEGTNKENELALNSVFVYTFYNFGRRQGK